MKLLRSLLGLADPSDSWLMPEIKKAILDLREKSICGVRLGQPASELERIGRPANRRPFKAQRFEYPDLGVVIDIEEGTIVDVQLVIVADEGESIPGRPCDVILPSAMRIAVTDATRWQDIEASLPKPQRVDRDEDEQVYFIALDRHRLDIECSTDDRIRRLNYYID